MLPTYLTIQYGRVTVVRRCRSNLYITNSFGNYNKILNGALQISFIFCTPSSSAARDRVQAYVSVASNTVRHPQTRRRAFATTLSKVR